MPEFLDVDDAIRNGSLKELQTNNRFSRVYRFGDEIVKIPTKSDFNHWGEGNFSHRDCLSKIPSSLQTSYRQSLPSGTNYNDDELAYAFWKTYEKTWQYNRLQKYLTSSYCGVPKTTITLGRAKLGLFRKSVVPVVRQSFVSGPTLREILEKSDNQYNPDVVLYRPKPEYEEQWDIIGRAIRAYLEGFAERRIGSAQDESYHQWIDRVFSSKLADPPLIQPILDMNPTNFVFDRHSKHLWYVDIDPEGTFLAKTNLINQETLCGVIGIHRVGRTPSCDHDWAAHQIGKCLSCGSHAGAWAGSYGPEYWYCHGCRSSSQHSSAYRRYCLSMRKCRKCGQVE